MIGKWITCADKSIETPIFVKKFELEKLPSSAEIDISALGYFELLINGEKVSDELFTPAQTDYAPRPKIGEKYGIPLNIDYRVLYLNYDISRFLTLGENTVEVIVGNGYWRQKEIDTEGSFLYSDELLCCFDIKLDEKIISTDGSEKVFSYPILRSNIFFGEIIDMRAFYEPLPEAEIEISDFKPQNLVLQDCPPERVVRKIKPKKITVCGKEFYDCGENITGWAKIAAKGNRGDQLKIVFAEEITDGELDHSTYSPPWRKSLDGEQQVQYEIFYLSGNADILRPKFVYHGFRYFEIIAADSIEIEDIEIEVIHTDIKVTSEFESDNAVLNWFYDAFIRTQLNNSHGSIPSDCPTRERLGYTGDGQLCCPATARIFDAKSYYYKWLEDIIDGQDKQTGRIQYTAPFMGGGGGTSGWGSAIVFVPFFCYNTYGDIGYLKRAYPSMKKWVQYMLDYCEDYVLCKTEGKLWQLGDWASTDEITIPMDYVNSCIMIHQLDVLETISDILGENDAEYYLELGEKCRQAVFKKFYKKGHYCGEVQAADAFAIWAELPKCETLFEPLAHRYIKLGRFDTGIIGTYVLLDILAQRADYVKLAVELMASTYPDYSFGSMMNKGQTTLGEFLDGRDSHDHPMFGAAAVFLFSRLLGITEHIAYKNPYNIRFSHCLDSIVKQASGSVMTTLGKAALSFSIGEKTIIDITVPEGAIAELRLGIASYTLSSGHNHFEF